MSIDLDKMSIAELEQIEKNAAAMVSRKREQAIADTRQQVKQIAASVGLSVEELMGVSKPRTAKAKTAKARKKRASKPVAAKYRNPKKPEETWSGRGRKPLWLQAELDKGKKLESFAI
ncbi:MAG TPA: H-NS histone family protein [Spongiibacteraceae bacterium]|nr:H-NS histone family protein [Spongiibacteraceae bacterium]